LSRDLTHLALIVLLDPETLDVIDVYVAVGPPFGIGEIDRQTGGVRLLLAEAKCSTIEQTDRTIWQMATKDYPWVLFDEKDKMRTAGTWVWRYEYTAFSRGVSLDECVIWGKRDVTIP